MKKVKAILFSIFIILILVAGLITGVFFAKKFYQKKKAEKMHTTVYERIQKVAELTLIKDNYCDVVSIKKQAVAGLSKSYSIVKFSGVVRVGIRDISKIKIGISSDGKQVNVLMPRSEIIGSGIVSQEVFDEKQSVFSTIETQEIFSEIQVAVEEKEKEIATSGILQESDEHLKSLITVMLKDLNFEKISFTQIAN